MSSVIHQSRPTPTQFGALAHRAKFHASINERAEAMKPKPIVIPIVAAEQPQPVTVKVAITPAELAERIENLAQELKDLRRINAGQIRLEFRSINGHPAVKDIQRAVASFYGVTMLDIQSQRRQTSIVLPRHVAIYLARTMTLLSLPQIGRKFGGRDHSTILHAVSNIEKKLKTNSKLASEIAAIKSVIVPLRPASQQNQDAAPCNSPPTTAE